MGGDNFNKSSDDKNSGQEYSLLGIRAAISQRLDHHQDTLESVVKNLTESMKVMEKIIQSLDAGEQSLNIPFPKGLAPDRKVIGKYNWSHVADRLVALILSEGIRAKYTTSKAGGCCASPALHIEEPMKKMLSRCKNCEKKFQPGSGPHNLSLLVLWDIK